MRVRRPWTGVLAASLVLAAPASAANQTVTAHFSPTLSFTPQTVFVNTGQMVTWNNGGGVHNVHFDDNSYVQPPTAQSGNWSVNRTFPTAGTFRYYCDLHGGPNGQGMAGVVQVSGPYQRPLSARKVQAALAPAFKECTAPNRQHGPPLTGGSCNPPATVSDWLRVGSGSLGNVTLKVQEGTPPESTDDANVRLIASISDVRTKAANTPYSGEVQVRLPLRLTDRLTGSGADEPATVSDQVVNVTVPCTAGSTSSTCSITTTLDAVHPGSIPEGKRSVWELDGVQVFDGGSDGVASTTSGNTLFATQALFVP
jgi:plastocyanin